MREKIIKLLNSSVYADIYIGLKLLDQQSRSKIPGILKQAGFVKEKNPRISWYKDLDEDIIGVPEECLDNYIKGKFYYYAIGSNSIIVDAPSVYRWTEKEFKDVDDSYKIIEIWI